MIPRLMQRALELAQGGHGQIVAVVGEPGVGKSRLCYEFKLHAPRGSLVLETFSVSHGKADPYLPLIELLKNYFQIAPQDDERGRREKVTGRVLTLDRHLEDTLPTSSLSWASLIPARPWRRWTRRSAGSARSRPSSGCSYARVSPSPCS